MKSLRTLLFTGIVMIFVSAPYRAPSQEKQPPPPSGQMKSMEKMSMDEMMKGAVSIIKR